MKPRALSYQEQIAVSASSLTALKQVSDRFNIQESEFRVLLQGYTLVGEENKGFTAMDLAELMPGTDLNNKGAIYNRLNNLENTFGFVKNIGRQEDYRAAIKPKLFIITESGKNALGAFAKYLSQIMTSKSYLKKQPELC